MIWTVENVENWNTSNIHEEFGTGPFNIPKGSILALGEEPCINVGRDKLAPMESIFSLATDVEKNDGEIGLKLDADEITIIVSQNTHQTINAFRGVSVGKAIVLNSVYLPAVMEVLSNLAGATHVYEDRRWYRLFSAKCDHFGIDMENPSLFEDAQKLLKVPFGDLEAAKERIAE